MEARKKRKILSVIDKIICYFFLVVIGIILIFPFYYMVARSFMTIDQLNERPLEMIPVKLTFASYIRTFSQANYFGYTFNTLKIVLFNVIAVPLASSFVAYGFARCRFYGRKIFFGIMLGTMMLPAIVMQIPTYTIFAKIGWLNTYLPLTIPNILGGGAMNVFLIRQFMSSLPKDLDEAAVVDGASKIRIYFTIILPLCTPILIFIVVGVFVANWGDYFGPLIYMNVVDESKYTLAYKIFRSSTTEYIGSMGESIKMAAGTFMSLFPALLFFLFQRQLVDGIVMSGIKG